MEGSLEILNVAEGDVKITFNHKDAPEAIRAKRIIKDMLQRGYALLIEVAPGEFQRIKEFNEEKGEYIIADLDPEGADESDPSKPTVKRRGRRPGSTKNVAMERVTATAVAPSAGG